MLRFSIYINYLHGRYRVWEEIMEDRNDLQQILSEIDAALTRCTRQPDPQLLHADKWVLASGLQKAIRRGELRTARSCAATLIQGDKQMLWRRLQVTALEDVGVGDAALVTQVIAAAAHANWRNQAGGDAKVVSYLVDRMCAAPKDRSADYLLYAATPVLWTIAPCRRILRPATATDRCHEPVEPAGANNRTKRIGFHILL